jgi:hypothetical protein
MEDTALNNLLQQYNHKLEEARVLNLQSWALNYKCFETLQTQKMRSKLNALMGIKIVGIVLGIAWVIFLGMLVCGIRFRNIYFSFSAIAIILFTLLAIAVYIRQVIMLKQIDYSKSITDTQNRLAALQVSSIKIARILVLQTPFYTTWFWSAQWMQHDIWFWLVAFPITILFTLLAVWLYKNITVKNIDNKKLRWLFSGPELSYISQAKLFLDEIETFRKD